MIFAAVLFVPLMIEMDSSSPSGYQTQAAANQFLSLHARVWPAMFTVFAPAAMTGHACT